MRKTCDEEAAFGALAQVVFIRGVKRNTRRQQKKSRLIAGIFIHILMMLFDFFQFLFG